jgi:hypothetical protein
MKSSISREGPVDTLPHAGARSGTGARSVVPYIDQDEDEKPSGTGAWEDSRPQDADTAAGDRSVGRRDPKS